MLDEAFKGGSRWKHKDMQRGLQLYTRVVVLVASLKRITNALEFMRQMVDLQLRIPVHLYIDVVSNAAEVQLTYLVLVEKNKTNAYAAGNVYELEVLCRSYRIDNDYEENQERSYLILTDTFSMVQ